MLVERSMLFFQSSLSTLARARNKDSRFQKRGRKGGREGGREGREGREDWEKKLWCKRVRRRREDRG